jgi:signal transduction histidine kinase
VALDVNDTTLRLSIDDDGDGGADPALGSGIIGLVDRVDALGGKLALRSRSAREPHSSSNCRLSPLGS